MDTKRPFDDMPEWYRATDEEEESIAEEAMEAAKEQLRSVNWTCEENTGVLVRATLRAFHACKETFRNAEKRLLAEHPDKENVYVSESSGIIVCGAFLSVVMFDEDDEIVANSRMGQNLMALLKANTALEAAVACYGAFENDDMAMASYAEEALLIGDRVLAKDDHSDKNDT